MISMPLFKLDMRKAINLMLLFLAILSMYSIVIIWMFDPEFASMLTQYQQMMPEMMAAFGMMGDTSSMIAFMNTYLYGFLMLIIPMIFEIMLVNHFVMQYVDNGSLACILSTPNSRKKVIVTQIAALLLSVFLLIGITAIIGYVTANVMYPGELDVEKYMLLNISMLLLHFAISAIAFFAACLFNEEKSYFLLGAGLPIAFYLIQMLSNMGENLEVLKYFTLYTLFPTERIVLGEGGVVTPNLTLILFALVLFIFGTVRFIKKDLPI
jgi:beta-exotoxin I transport system permease protein